MKTKTLWFALLLLVCYAAAADEPESVRVRGNVLTMRDLMPEDGPGVRFQLETKQGVIDVHVGQHTAAFEHANSLTRGEGITVVGFRIRLDGKTTIEAQEVRREGSERDVHR